MKFDHMELTFDGKLQGSGSDEAGNFTITGEIRGDEISIQKDYGAWVVMYGGNAQPGENKWTGSWCIQGQEGMGEEYFELEVEMHKWKGKYEKDGRDVEMQMEMKIGDKEVYGQGSDEVGRWIARGTRDGDRVEFKKQYLGAHSMDYFGKIDGHKMEGEWGIEDARGKFKMEKD